MKKNVIRYALLCGLYTFQFTHHSSSTAQSPTEESQVTNAHREKTVKFSDLPMIDRQETPSDLRKVIRRSHTRTETTKPRSHKRKKRPMRIDEVDCLISGSNGKMEDFQGQFVPLNKQGEEPIFLPPLESIAIFNKENFYTNLYQKLDEILTKPISESLFTPPEKESAIYLEIQEEYETILTLPQEAQINKKTQFFESYKKKTHDEPLLFFILSKLFEDTNPKKAFAYAVYAVGAGHHLALYHTAHLICKHALENFFEKKLPGSVTETLQEDCSNKSSNVKTDFIRYTIFDIAYQLFKRYGDLGYKNGRIMEKLMLKYKMVSWTFYEHILSFNESELRVLEPSIEIMNDFRQLFFHYINQDIEMMQNRHFEPFGLYCILEYGGNVSYYLDHISTLRIPDLSEENRENARLAKINFETLHEHSLQSLGLFNALLNKRMGEKEIASLNIPSDYSLTFSGILSGGTITTTGFEYD